MSNTQLLLFVDREMARLVVIVPGEQSVYTVFCCFLPTDMG